MVLDFVIWFANTISEKTIVGKPQGPIILFDPKVPVKLVLSEVKVYDWKEELKFYQIMYDTNDF